MYLKLLTIFFLLNFDTVPQQLPNTIFRVGKAQR